jgi:hypothetical protein
MLGTGWHLLSDTEDILMRTGGVDYRMIFIQYTSALSSKTETTGRTPMWPNVRPAECFGSGKICNGRMKNPPLSRTCIMKPKHFLRSVI